MTYSNEQRYYDALREIAKYFVPVDRITEKSCQKQGLEREEFLEMAYENMQKTALNAIYGRKRPKGEAS